MIDQIDIFFDLNPLAVGLELSGPTLSLSTTGFVDIEPSIDDYGQVSVRNDYLTIITIRRKDYNPDFETVTTNKTYKITGVRATIDPEIIELICHEI